MTGGSLQDYIRKNGVLAESESIILLEALLRIVNYLNSKQIIHRDIKPENIMLRSPKITIENFVLIDFGLAIYINECPKELRKYGTPGFISPEMLDKTEKLDFKSDIFSVGITWYYALFGSLPYQCKSKDNLINLNKSGVFTFENSHKFLKIEWALNELLNKNPKLRTDAQKALSSDFLFNLKYVEDDTDEIDGGRLFQNHSNLFK